MSGERIGIFGGTFDPVHIGHLLAANEARHACRLDRVLLEVAPRPWQKVGTRVLAPAELRYAAVAAAVEGLDGLEASRRELDRGGLTYTIDTLEHLHFELPDARLFLIMGTDAAAGVDTWRDAPRVGELAELVILNRPGAPWPDLGENWRVRRVLMPAMDVSSTEIRDRLRSHRPLDFLIPRAALDVIAANGHYAGTETA